MPRASGESSSSVKPPAPAPQSSAPRRASHASTNIVFAAGAAIFHLRTKRVVVCRHGGVWFLPKGRKNASEPIDVAAVREGFEESGFRCRVLPLPVPHRQPVEDDVGGVDLGRGMEGQMPRRKRRGGNVLEPVWTQLLPLPRGVQYVLLWFVAETLSREDELAANEAAMAIEGGEHDAAGGKTATIQRERLEATTAFVLPAPWPNGLSIAARCAVDSTGQHSAYEPVRHADTGVDEEERQYESHLVPVGEAFELLGGGVQSDVVRQGWDLIQRRDAIEKTETEGAG